MLELWDLQEPEAVQVFVTIRKTPVIQHKKPTTSWRVVNNDIQIHDGYFYGRDVFPGSRVTLWHLSVLSHQKNPMCHAVWNGSSFCILS